MRDQSSRNEPTDVELGHIMTVARWAALRMGANDAEADEIAQSVVVRFWERWNSAGLRSARNRTATRWDGYIRRTAVNLYRDRIRGHQRRLFRQYMASTTDPTVSFQPGTSTLTQTAPCQVENFLARTHIAELIRELPNRKQRQIAWAVFVDGKSSTEVATELGIQPQTVRKHLRPARERLIQDLTAEEE